LLAGYETVVIKLEMMKEFLETFELCEMPSPDPGTDDGVIKTPNLTNF
jgi:hypothetical protein